jgi:hypothetical protein
MPFKVFDLFLRVGARNDWMMTETLTLRTAQQRHLVSTFEGEGAGPGTLPAPLLSSPS